ncbi:hypothetical protein L195_g042517 [Trifolium pratense]|uniref:Uncharacterized protein n=1 Tax=Trifolium pratense TaxID=57577 RepID=A0A2K3M6P7_TRIPR|nr:hypothetical protein L195_g042517 [Trifolium pratense]
MNIVDNSCLLLYRNFNWYQSRHSVLNLGEILGKILSGFEQACSFGDELLYGLIYFQTYVNLLHLECGVCAKVIMLCLKFVEEFSGLNSAAYLSDGKLLRCQRYLRVISSPLIKALIYEFVEKRYLGVFLEKGTDVLPDVGTSDQQIMQILYVEVKLKCEGHFL